MPRGSDAEAAGTELKARTGMDANAEDYIEANNARWTAELLAANKRPIDQAATDEMDEGEAEGYLEGDQTVLSYAVRGPFVVVVAEDNETGEVTKEAFALKGKDKQAERAMRTVEPPEEETAEEEAKDEAKTEAKETGHRAGTAAKRSS